MSNTIEIENKLNSIREIDNRESQLWWLAVLIILLLSITLFFLDWTNSVNGWWVSSHLKFILNTVWMRITLIIAVLLICTYFRDTVRQLRHRNGELVESLSQYGKQLEKKKCQAENFQALSEKLISELELEKALDLIIDVVVDTSCAENASILLCEQDNDLLHMIVSRGILQDKIESKSIYVDDIMTVTSGKAVITNSDYISEKTEKHNDCDNIYHSAIVPIHVGDKIRGVIIVEKNNSYPSFTNGDFGTLYTLANQASLVIQRIDLLNDLRNKINALANTVEELNMTQTELIQSEKLASIGLLAGGVAHEINNPLQVVLGRTELLIAKESGEDSLRELNSILEHTVRITNTVSNLLSFSRQSNNTEFRFLDVNVVVLKTLELLEPQMIPDDIVVLKNLRKDLPSVYGCACQLQQIFTNLIINAYHAMLSKKGGTLHVETGIEDNFVFISFQDTGPGISPEHIAHIFEPFFTTKPEGQGTGLGLSIVYGIVQSHKGNIDVQSSSNGTCFKVKLPLGGWSDAQTEEVEE